MSVSKLAIALSVTFVVSVLFLIVKLLFILLQRCSDRHQQPQIPISSSNQHSQNLLHLFCLKSRTRVEPSGAPTETSSVSSADDPVIDVFKLLEANRPSRFLCTIKEDDGEYVESTSGVDCVEIPVASEKVSLKAFLEFEAAEERAVKDKVVLSPCDSPMFYTPVGSPARDDLTSEVVSIVTGR